MPSAELQGQGVKGVLQRAEALGGQASFKAQPGQGVMLQVNRHSFRQLLSRKPIFQSITVPIKSPGSLSGGILTAAATIPIVLAQTGIYLGNSVSSGIWLWFILVVLLLTITGWMTARFVQAQNRSAQMLQSSLAGIGTIIIAYGIILAVSPAIQGMDALLNHGLNPASEAYFPSHY